MKKLLLFTFMVVASVYSFSQVAYAQYPLDGNANDISGNNLDGTIYGSASGTANRFNQSSKALALNGSSKYVALPQSFDFPNLTVIGWFKAYSTGGNGITTVIYSSDNSSLQYGHQKFLLEDVSTFPQVRIQSGDVSYVKQITLNEWHQLAFTRTQSQVKVFIDGVLEHTNNNPGDYHSNSGVNYATIGAGYTLANFLNGDIDDFRIYDSALSDSQIVVNFSSVKALKELESQINVYNQSGTIVADVHSDALSKIVEVSLYNYEGKLMQSKNISEAKTKLNDGSLPAGLYLITFRLRGSDQLVTKKITIQ